MRLALLLLGLALLPLAGCGDDAAPDEATPAVDSTATAAPTGNTVLMAAREAGLSTFETLVRQAGFDTTLTSEGPLTVFAPTNAAFDRLPEGTLDRLLSDEYRDELVKLLNYHVVSGRLETASLPGTATYETLLGAPITIEPAADGVYVSDAVGTRARVITPDLNRGNGVVHVINAVLTAPDVVPGDSAAAAAAAPTPRPAR